MKKSNNPNPFSVPENYFENFQQEIVDKVTKENDSSFQVPEQFFEQQEQEILANIKPETKVFKLQTMWKVAAVLVMMLGASWMFYNTNSDTVPTEIVQTETVEHESIVSDLYDLYIEEPEDELEPISTDVIAEYYALVSDIPENQPVQYIETSYSEPETNSTEHSEKEALQQESAEIIYDAFFDEETYLEEEVYEEDYLLM